MRWTLLVPFSLLYACSGNAEDTSKTDDTADTSDSGDTGDSGPDDPYKDLPTGCITLGGQGDYPSINEAITYASDGQAVGVCAGTYTETVLLDKGVSVVGESSDSTFLQVSDGRGFTITGTGAAVSGFTIETDDSAVLLDAVSAVSLSDLILLEAGGWGVEARNAEITADNLLFEDVATGGVYLDGGSLTLTGSTFDASPAYGVHAVNGAEVVSTGNVYLNIAATTDDLSDGIGIFAAEGTVTSTGDTFDGATLAAVDAESGAQVSMSAGSITNSYYGMLVLDAGLEVDGLTIDGCPVQGIFAYVSAGAMVVKNATISVDPASAYDIDYATWGVDDFAGGGILMQAPEMTISDTTIDGYNDYGIALFAPTEDPADTVVTLSGVLVNNTGRRGIYLSGGSGTVADTTVSNMREPELPSPCTSEDGYNYVDQGTATLALQGEFTFTNYAAEANQGWGLSNIYGVLTVDGGTFSTNACSQYVDYDGVTTMSGVTFTGATDMGNVSENYGALTLVGNTFTANHAGYTSAYTAGGHLYQYKYASGQALDVFIYGGSPATIQGNTFVDGDNGVLVYDGDAEFSGNLFSAYEGYVIEAFGGSTTITVTSDGDTFDGVGANALYAYAADFQVRDATVTNSGETPVSYDYYLDEVFQYTSSYTYTGGVFYAQSASMSLDGVVMSDSPGYLFYGYETSVEISDTTATNIAGYGLYYYGYSAAPDIDVRGLSIDGVSGSGVYLQYYGADTGFVSLEDVSVSNTTGYGAYLYAPGEVYLSEVTVDGSSSDGIYVYGASAAELVDVRVSGAGSYGVNLSQTTSVLSGVSATGSTYSGLMLGGGAADVQGNAFTTNDQYGMECSGVSLTACAGNDLSDNGAGAHSGCDDACAI